MAVAHGLGEHSGRYGRLAEALRARGHACCAVDLRGMGGSAGRRALLQQTVKARRFVLSNPAFRLAVEVPGWKRRLAQVASLVLPTLTLSNRIDPRLLSREPEVVAAYRADPLVHDRISSRLYVEWARASRQALERASEVAIPFLLIVSEADRLVDSGGAEEFWRRAGSRGSLRRYPGRYHEPFTDLGATEVFADLAAWLERPEQPSAPAETPVAF